MEILDDRESGSVALLNRLTDALEKELAGSYVDGPIPGVEEFNSLLLTIGKKLKPFAAIENFLASLIRITGHGSTFPQDALSFIADYRSQWEQSPAKIADNFLRQIQPEGRTILTHSHSQTIISLLDRLNRRKIPFRVIQTLSVPGEEGRISHERMLRMKLQADLVHEADLKDALKQCDLILVGCDALTDREFLNKTGTRSILEQAQQFRLPAFLIAESRKRVSSPAWKYAPGHQSLFEWVPLLLVRAIVTEDQHVKI